MDKAYKAVRYNRITHHDEVVDPNHPWNNSPAYDSSEIRYCIVATDTGEVLDDAQGYGYKTAQKAYSAYAYKTRDKSKDKERAAKKEHIKQWMRENKSFVRMMDDYAFQIAKGAMAPDDKFDAKFVQMLLNEENMETDFTASELFRVWRGR